MTNYLSIQTKLDKTVKRDQKFHLHTVQGEEGICKDFVYRLRVSCPERLTKKETEKLVGQSVSISIDFIDKKGQVGHRFINGIVYELMELGMSHDPLMPEIWRYELEISSWLRKLDHVKDCRIFQKNGNTSAKIVSDLFRELGFRDFKFEIGGKLPKLEYSVMFDEPISNYIKRIIQDDNLIWHFRHNQSKHELVFSDDSLGLPEIQDLSYGKYEGVKSFSRESIHIPINKYTIGSYEYNTPPVKNVQSVINTKTDLNYYQYPGCFIKREDGEKKVKCVKQGLQSQVTRFYGESTIRSLTAGYQFNLNAPVLSDLHQQRYLIKDLEIKASREEYNNKFVALPAKDQYFSLDEEAVLKPTIIGSQTAVVVGEKGVAEVPGTYRGRVKIRFHWDHYSADNSSNTSAYVRVSSPATGSQKGAVFTPRIGEEVVVSFEDGDPEKPIIMGGVYSQGNASPNMKEAGSLLEMIMDDVTKGKPEKRTPLAQPFVGTIKSDGDSDSNRLTFNDKSGSEYVEINGKKDINFKVGHNLNIDVDEDIYIFVNNNESINVSKNVNTKAGGSIINGTIGPIRETAGKDKLNMALGGVLNIAGGVISNKAGATMTNTAILSVDNSSGGVLAQIAGVILANTCAGGISCSSEMISQKGDMVVLNLSLANIINSASKEIKTKTLLHKSTVDEKSITDTGDYKIKALMPKIN